MPSYAEKQTPTTRLDGWFDDLIATLNAHQLQYQTSTLPTEKEHFYNFLANADMEDLHRMSRDNAQRHFVQRIILDFLDATTEMDIKQLYFDYNDSQVLAWAVLGDDDEVTEGLLILAKAKVNAKYVKYGFSIDLMLMEECDNYPAPEHYRPVTLLHEPPSSN